MREPGRLSRRLPEKTIGPITATKASEQIESAAMTGKDPVPPAEPPQDFNETRPPVGSRGSIAETVWIPTAAVISRIYASLWSWLGKLAGPVQAILGLLVFGFLFERAGLIDLILPSTDAQIFIDSPQVYTRERLVNDRFREQAWLEKQLQDLKDNENLIASVEQRVSVATFLTSELAKEVDGKPPPPELLKERVSELQTLLKNVSGAGQPASVLFPDRFRKNQGYREIVRRALIENELDDRHDLGSNSLYLFKFGAAIIPESRTTSPVKIAMTLSQGAELKPMQHLITDPEHPCFNLYEFECGYLASRFAPPDNNYHKIAEEGQISFGAPAELAVHLTEWDNLYQKWLSDVSRQYQNSRELVVRIINSQSYKSTASVKFQQTISRLERESAELGSKIPEIFLALGSSEDVRIKLESKGSSLRDEVEIAIQNYFRKLLTKEFTLHRLDIENLQNDALFRVERSTDGEFAADEFINAGIKFRLAELAPHCLMYDDPYEVIKIASRDKEVLKDQTAFRVRLRSAFISFITNCILNEFSVSEETGSELGPTGRLEFGGPSSVSLYPAEGTIYAYVDQSALRFPRVEYLSKQVEPASRWKGKYSRAVKFGTKFVDLFYKPDAGSISPEQRKGGAVPAGLFYFIQKMSAAQSSFSYNVTPRAEFDLESSATSESRDVAGRLGFLGISGAGSNTELRTGIKKSHRILGYASQGNSTGTVGEAQFGWVVLPAEEQTWLIPRNRMQAANESLSALISVPAWWGSVKIDVEIEWIEPSWFRPAKKKLSTILVDLPVRLDLIENVLVNSSAQPPFVIADTIRKFSVNACDAAAIMLPGRHLWRSTVVTIGSQKADLIQVMPDMTGIIAYFNQIMPPRFEPDDGGKNLMAALSYSVPLDINIWTSEGHETITDKVSVHVPADFKLRSKFQGWACPQKDK